MNNFTEYPNNRSTLRIELGLSAQKIIQQMELNNQSLEEVIKKGVMQAFGEISKEENLQEMISAQTKIEIKNIVSNVVFDFQFKNKVREAIVEKMGKKIDEYANKIADQLTKNLK